MAGAVIGGIVFVMCVPGAKWWHCALGPPVFYAAIIAAVSKQAHHAVEAGLVTVFTMILGAIGGAIGAASRRNKPSAAALPEARQIHEQPPR
jgi:hypothetical protein